MTHRRARVSTMRIVAMRGVLTDESGMLFWLRPGPPPVGGPGPSARAGGRPRGAARHGMRAVSPAAAPKSTTRNREPGADVHFSCWFLVSRSSETRTAPACPATRGT
eukprot:3929145-Prymnesium_polylepis.1